jgi:hypothetical protein
VSLDKLFVDRVHGAVSRRQFLKRTVGWGTAMGFALSGASSILNASPAWAVSCTGLRGSGLNQCTHDCTGSYCSGCCGSEGTNGCPSGYSQYTGCGYSNPACWCTNTVCVSCGGVYEKRHRVCCDCRNNNTGATCTCCNAYTYLGKCGTSQWVADGSIVAASCGACDGYPNC